MGKLDGKVAIVTGGGSGIGKGIARALAAQGAKIVVAGRRIEALNKTVEEIAALGQAAVAIPTDVTDEAQVAALFAGVVERFQRVDILVNNAGAVDGGPLDELSVETWDKVIATNLRGPFLCTRSAMRLMKPQGGGRIINIGSISAQRPRFNSGPYSTSKFGIWGLTITTSLEGRAHGISACCLHPGNVRVETVDEEVGSVTGISDYAREPKMEVEEIAEVAALMASLPPHINMLEAIVLPVEQAYLARG
jgi:NAD(P)-dependent dehydrogenase (short-subunit alcohol dehydrogenase family)